MIQVLPVNDTCVYGTWWDSYPYSTLSVHALHPQYLALRELLADEGQQLPQDLASEVRRTAWRGSGCRGGSEVIRSLDQVLHMYHIVWASCCVARKTVHDNTLRNA